MVVVFVCAQVLGQGVDTRGEERDLDVGRAVSVCGAGVFQ